MRIKPLCPKNKKIRVIIDSDAGCECDDLFAILHALMSDKLEVCGIIAEHYGTPVEDTMENSYHEIKNLLDISGNNHIPVLKGAYKKFTPGMDSCDKYVDFLVNEADKSDPRPLFMIGQGALTNIAYALNKAPHIAGKLTLIQIGGCNYPEGGFEFNAMNDKDAFNYVMQSNVSIWMIPENVYSTVLSGILELCIRTEKCGRTGDYISEKLLAANIAMAEKLLPHPGEDQREYVFRFPEGESWSLGDSCGIGILLAHNCGHYRLVQAPCADDQGKYHFSPREKLIRWYDNIDGRFILEDFFSKMNIYYG